MISVDAALTHLFELVTALRTERVPRSEAAGRVMVRDAMARREQPPFASSAMDGYAVRSEDVAPGSRLEVVGESAAGHRFKNALQPNECVRIFTGAPVPEGADRIIIQEDITRDGDHWPERAKTGMVRLALRSGAPVVPVAMIGAHRVIPRRRILTQTPGRTT